MSRRGQVESGVSLARGAAHAADGGGVMAEGARLASGGAWPQREVAARAERAAGHGPVAV
jgi:hypothetical protein